MQAQAFAPAPVGNDPVIAFDDIQGDVLIGLQKDAEAFIFFTIDDVAAFKKALRNAILPLVTSAKDVRRRERQIADAKAAGLKTRFLFLGLNIGFTSAGLTKLGAPTAGMDPAFVAGAHTREGVTGDDLTLWPEAYAGGDIDGGLLITAPNRAAVTTHANSVLALLGATIKALPWEEGATRPQRGHEHFGFLDGVSQPGIRGLTKPQNPLDPDQGLPGQDLLWPGEFVFGYPGQKHDDMHAPGPPPAMASPWMKNGSYLVWRRLEQKVLAFRARVTAEAATLGMDEQLLAARMVGRWPSGAPLSRAPLQDDITLGPNPMENNNFEFGNDGDQRRCPFAAHIRKTYPRDDMGDEGEADVQTHRFRRSGIPFGPEVDEKLDKIGAEQSRGLMFVCYQTSITEQFEFVQTFWVNNPDFVVNKTRPGGGPPIQPGHDPILGHMGAARVMDEPVPNYPVGNVRSTLNLPDAFVIPKAGAYLFVPSLPALKAAPIGR